MKGLFLILILTAYLFSYQNRYTVEQVQEDFNKGDTAKYNNDFLGELNSKTLLEKKIVEEKDLNNPLDFKSMKNIKSKIQCDAIVGSEWTASVYDIDFESGNVKCMVSKLGDLYNPIGFFKVFYPDMKSYFTKDNEAAVTDNQRLMQRSELAFQGLLAEKDRIKSSYIRNSETYLNTPDLLLAAILTDTNIIDMASSADTNKLQLKNSYTSQYSDNGIIYDNSEYIKTDASNLFANYRDIGSLSMSYLFIIVFFFAAYSVGSAFARPISDKWENHQNQDKKIPYMFGIFFGMLFFFPLADEEVSSANQSYEIMHSKIQDFEKDGYYLFASWADDIAEIIINNELNSIIAKSNTGNKEQLINAYSGMKKYEKLEAFSSEYYSECKNDVYTGFDLKTEGEQYDNNIKKSGDVNNRFPITENWMYATNIVNNSSGNYYSPAEKGGLIKFYPSHIKEENKIKNYPPFSISSCGKMYYKLQKYTQKRKDYENSFALSTEGLNSSDNGDKILMIKELITFQYGLQRDYGYLSILGLPVIKLQTEMIGNLYKKSDVTDRLNQQISNTDDSKFLHSLFSSIPYMFLPGAGTIYQSTLGAMRDIRNGYDKSATGIVGGLFGGGIVTGALANTVGFSLGYIIATTVLSMLPIVSIVIIGLMRFVSIMMKILIFHYGSLLIMPIMFVRENTKAISAFSMKIFATMLELPIFVMSVWLAMSANSLLHSFADGFSKKIILGMLKNTEAQHNNAEFSLESLMNLNFEWADTLKIYFFDGLLEVAVGVFSIVIIYKIIITLHNTLFELIEVNGTKSLDSALETMKNDASSWGTKV